MSRDGGCFEGRLTEQSSGLRIQLAAEGSGGVRGGVGGGFCANREQEEEEEETARSSSDGD